MPRKRLEESISPEKMDEVRQAQKLLSDYFRGGIGRQKAIAEASGIYASVLSRMACGHSPISMEVAVALDVATNGELRAERLCPIRADVLQRFVSQRQNAEA